MNTPGQILLVNLLVLGSVTLCLAQVSFSTNWGTGKRSPAASSIFKDHTENHRRQSAYNTGQDELQEVLRDRSQSDITDCLANFENNVMTFMSLLFESELKKTKACIMAKQEVLYD